MGTVERQVVEVLLHRRIGLFEETIGGLDPILGNVERDLNKIFAAADDEAEAAKLESFERNLEVRVHGARKAERQRADFIMDTKSYRQDEVDALLERRGTTSNDDLRRFVLGAIAELGCFIEEDQDLVGVYDVTLKNRFPQVFPQYYGEGAQRRVTFDRASRSTTKPSVPCVRSRAGRRTCRASARRESIPARAE